MCITHVWTPFLPTSGDYLASIELVGWVLNLQSDKKQMCHSDILKVQNSFLEASAAEGRCTLVYVCITHIYSLHRMTTS